MGNISVNVLQGTYYVNEPESNSKNLTLPFAIDLNGSVKALKAKINVNEGTPAADQALCFQRSTWKTTGHYHSIIFRTNQ